GVGIPEINEELDLGLPEGDYQTVAGFILDSLGRIPEEGDMVEFENLRMTVKEMNGVKIETLELRRMVFEADGAVS
ncbi:MAG: transporter associated domain-containing protein, partial [Dehalococcoidia bacterium]